MINKTTICTLGVLVALVSATAALAATTVGTQSNDTIFGTKDADVIDGIGGNDVINGLGGADRLTGGFGSDRIMGEERVPRIRRLPTTARTTASAPALEPTRSAATPTGTT